MRRLADTATGGGERVSLHTRNTQQAMTIGQTTGSLHAPSMPLGIDSKRFNEVLYRCSESRRQWSRIKLEDTATASEYAKNDDAIQADLEFAQANSRSLLVAQINLLEVEDE
jgi:hypothetical protein